MFAFHDLGKIALAIKIHRMPLLAKPKPIYTACQIDAAPWPARRENPERAEAIY
jgi:hypothetical protein